MSLINQMLQDLEQRSAGGINSVPSGIHGQIRAVPARRRIHPAWWMLLLVPLAGAAVWYWMRPALQARPAQAPQTAQAVQQVQQVQQMQPATNLSLKIASQLGALPPDTDPAVPPPNIAAPAPEPKPYMSLAPETPREDNKVAEKVIEKAAEPKAAETPKAQQAAPVKTDEARPAEVTKHVSELTPQQHAENEYREAAVLIQAGKQAEAIAILQQALKLDARHAGVRETLIGLLLQARRSDDALKVAQDGLALDPAQPGLTMILARVQLDQGDLHTALATMEHGMPYAGSNAEYHAFTAALMIRDKRNKDAIQQYTAALTVQPQNGVWWMGLGMALQSENHLPEAREAFLRADRSDTLTPELKAFVEQKLAQLPKP
ncbi:MAG TPA: tetratricopeptide repeat protein [Burkholderiaceae bacterium]